MADYTGIISGIRNNLRQYMCPIWGYRKIYNTYEFNITGYRAIIQVYEKYESNITGYRAILQIFENEIQGRRRVANDSDDQYELYIGQDAEPDLTAAPDFTFTGSSQETGALAAGHDYYFVTRKRNKYGIISQNILSTVITIDAGGDETDTAPSNATDISVEQTATYKARIRAIYHGRQDTTAANTWLLYIETDGGDPNPAVETPYEVAMEFEGGVSFLDYEIGPYADNTIFKVIIRTRIAGTPDIDSDDTDIYVIIGDITYNLPGEVDPDIMSDDIYKHAQSAAVSAVGLNFEFDGDLDGVKYVINEDEDGNEDLTQARLVQFNDVFASNLNIGLWDNGGGTCTEAGNKVIITAGGGGLGKLTGMKSEGTPNYNMFQFADIRMIMNIPGAPPDVVYSQVWWHANLNMSILRIENAGSPYLQWNVYDLGGAGNQSGNFAFDGTRFAVRLHRTTANVATVSYRPDAENYKLDTGWTDSTSYLISGSQVASKTGRAIVTVQKAATVGEVEAIWKKPDDGDKFYPPEQLDPIAYLRLKAFEWAAHDSAGVNVTNVEMAEDLPTDCKLYYVYTSNATGTRPNKAAMVALFQYTTFAAFKAALEADAGLDKYLYIGVLLYGPTKTSATALNDLTPAISAPVLEY